MLFYRLSLRKYILLHLAATHFLHGENSDSPFEISHIYQEYTTIDKDIVLV